MVDQWQPILIFLSIASMIFGAVAAIGQNNLKRLNLKTKIIEFGKPKTRISITIICKNNSEKQQVADQATRILQIFQEINTLR